MRMFGGLIEIPPEEMEEQKKLNEKRAKDKKAKKKRIKNRFKDVEMITLEEVEK